MLLEAVSQQVRTFVIENYLFGQERTLQDDESFLDAGIIDSTGVLELVAFLEDKYDIKVADDELTIENLDSVRKVSEYVRRKLAVASPEADPASDRTGVVQSL